MELYKNSTLSPETLSNNLYPSSNDSAFSEYLKTSPGTPNPKATDNSIRRKIIAMDCEMVKKGGKSEDSFQKNCF